MNAGPGPGHRTAAADTSWATVAALAVLAMCAVTFDHEALGHGGVCVALGGHVQVLTSSIFRCSASSPLIALSGPATNALIGAVALWACARVARPRVATRLFLALVAAFSLYWESGYLIKAMIHRDGDLYYAASDLVGEPSSWWRILGIATGVLGYLGTARWSFRALHDLFPQPGYARRAGRIAWTAATVAATLAAALDPAHGRDGLRDAILEIGAGALPLLRVAGAGVPRDDTAAPPTIRLSLATIGASLAVYAAFAATLGRGLGA